AAIFTGCRYGELGRLQVADYQSGSGTLAIRASKTGTSRFVILTDEAQAFFQRMVVGKTSTDLIFARADCRGWGKSHQHRLMPAACYAARIVPPISFHVLRHTHASLLAMSGVPIPIIAKQLGHADTRITERHYAHLSRNYVADAIRAGFPSLEIT